MSPKKSKSEDMASSVKREKTLEGKKAKKDFEIHLNEHHFKIKEGDDLSKVPALFYDNLKTEGVI